MEEADAALPTGSLVAYTDASCTDIRVVTSTVVQGRPSISANYVYRLITPVPSVSAELLAIRDAKNLVIAASTSPAPIIIIRTDSTSAIKEIRKVYSAHPVANEVHRMTAQMPGQIRIQWIPRGTISAHIQADTATHSELPLAVEAHFPSDPQGDFLHRKEILRHTTRDLIPPCGSNLPGGLTRQEEVVLRRLRVGVALTPSVTYAWPQHLRGSFADTCPYCPARASATTIKHLLWTCPGLTQVRRRYLETVGLHPTLPPDYESWLYGSNHRALLLFIAETGLHFYI